MKSLFPAACLLTTSLFANEPHWHISTTEDWQAFIADAEGVTVADNHAVAEKPEVSFSSQVKTFSEPNRLQDVELRQSVEWVSVRFVNINESVRA